MRVRFGRGGQPFGLPIGRKPLVYRDVVRTVRNPPGSSSMSIPGQSPESVSQAPRSGPGGRPFGLAPVELDPRDLPIGFLCVAWCALVGIGILGRLWQPVYGVSPLIGIGLCAGALFANRFIAASVPAVALAASNYALPGGGVYGSWTMAAIIYAAFTWPVLMGSLVRRHRGWGALGGALAGSLVFFLSTNLAHWWLTTDYAHTLGGLIECYVAALPFYRWTPVGDIGWALALSATLLAVPALARPFRSAEVA